MSFLRRPALFCAVLAVSVALALSACGAHNAPASQSSAGNPPVGTAHAVVGFAAHAGLAFGAFKLFIEDPYRAGKLSFHHPFTLAKAAAAALFAYHETKVAYAELRGHPKLAFLARSIGLLTAALGLLRGGLAHGNTSAVGAVQNRIGSVSGQASAAGSPIHANTSGLHL